MLTHLEPRQAARVHSIGKLRYEVQPGPGYLRVEFAGEIESVEIADDWLEHIEDMLHEHDLHKVLWDSRPVSPLLSDVRDHFWAWVENTPSVEASAILADSELLRLSANLTGVSRKIVLKSFGQPDEAIAWLSEI